MSRSDGHHSGGSSGHYLFYVPLDLTAIIPEVLAATTLVAAAIHFMSPNLTAIIPEVLAAGTLAAAQAVTVHLMFSI